MPSLRLLECGIHGMGAPSTSSRGAQESWPQRNSALSWLFTNWAFLSLGSLVFLCCLAPFWGPTSSSSKSSTILFFFKFGLAFSLRSRMSCGGGRGRLVGTCVLGASFEVNPLFLLANRPFKPVLYFRSMPFSYPRSYLWLGQLLILEDELQKVCQTRFQNSKAA